MMRLGNIITAAATVLVAAAVFIPAPARAGNVLLWACHGPGGEGLGEPKPRGAAPPPLSSAPPKGEGRAEKYGQGCEAQAGTGGLWATFSSPEPSDSSEASWRLAVPEGVTLESVQIERTVSGFGETAMVGDPQWYRAEASSGLLESESLEASDPLPSVLEGAAKGEWVRLGVGCGPTPVVPGRCEKPESGETVGVKISSIALGVRDSAPPQGAVGGRGSPASGTLNLTLDASDPGLGLASAEASLEGGPSTFVRLGSGACPEHPSGAMIQFPLGAQCPESRSNVPLPLDIAAVPDGEHTLRVSVTDAAGNTATLVDQPIVVQNEKTPTGAEATALIGIGGGGAGPAAAGTGAAGAGAGGVLGSFSSSTPGGKPVACQLPDLSMKLTSKPLRYAKHHVPVLRARRHYVFRGHLTCLLHNRRVSAPTGIVLRALYTLKAGHRTYRTYASGRGTMTVHNGNLRAILGYYSARTIIFRYKPGNGEFAQVKIPIEVVHAKAKKHGA